uniref:F-box domain-containing protein n=2 Tax=Oryza TaxID=4527 RepID=A0A0E0GNG0_ORYNI
MELLCDDLLDSILLRLDSPVCLIRAASVCKRWRRVAAADDAAGFLRRIAPSTVQPSTATTRPDTKIPSKRISILADGRYPSSSRRCRHRSPLAMTSSAPTVRSSTAAAPSSCSGG